MKKIYIFPFLFDFVTFMVFMFVADASGRELHFSNLQAALLIVVYSLCYLLVCLFAGSILHRGNARRFLIASTIGQMALSAPLYFVRAFWPMMILIGLLGGAVAFCFNSFQTFMRGEAPPGSLTRTISRYTLSWSSGIACGFLLGGLLKTAGGPWALAVCSTIAGLVVLALVLTHTPRDLADDSADGAVEEHETARAPVDARYVAVGWMLCLSANFCQRPLTTFLPKFYAQAHFPAFMSGLLLFAAMFGQAAMGYCGRRWRPWLYHRPPLFLMQLLLVVCIGLLWAVPNYWFSLLVMLALGGIYGCIYFAAVYYVSNDARSSRNVGINEAMVGLGNIGGLLMSQWVINGLHNEAAIYPTLMLSILAVVLGQWILLRRAPVADKAGALDLYSAPT